MFDKGEVCVLKCRDELISEGSVDITTIIVLSMLFGMLTEERLLVEGVVHSGMWVVIPGSVRQMNGFRETRAD